MWSGNPALINYCEEQEEEEEGGEVRFVMRESWVWSRHQGDISQSQFLGNSLRFKKEENNRRDFESFCIQIRVKESDLWKQILDFKRQALENIQG